MNTTRRSAKLLAVAAASALIFAACGSDDDTSAPEGTDAAETGDTTETETETTEGGARPRPPKLRRSKAPKVAP